MRLRQVAEAVRNTITPVEMDPIVDHYSIPALDRFGLPARTESTAIDSHKLLLSGGEILVSRLNPRKPRVFCVPEKLPLQAVASTEFVALLSLHVDDRFLRYWLLSSSVMQALDSRVRSATRSHQRVDPSEILSLELPQADPVNQRRIADFLDNHVSRIDRIISARHKQQAPAREALLSELDHLTKTRAPVQVRPLQTLTNPKRPIQYGIVLPGPDFPGGVPIIKGGDIGSGRLKRGELNRTDPEIDARYARSRVTPGDIVIAIRGSVGEIEVVPDAVSVANLTQDTARIAPGHCDRNWLMAVLAAPSIQGEIAKRTTGSTIRGINIETLRRIPIPLAHPEHQSRIAADYISLKRISHRREIALERSIDLLTEYKQSLITAAVNGDFDVTAATTKIPEF